VEVERPKPAPYSDPEPEPQAAPWYGAVVLFAFTLPITAAWEPLAWAVAWIGTLVIVAALIVYPLAYAARKASPPE
jgi:hypothetical protein